MRFLAFLIALFLWLALVLALRAVVDFRYRRIEEYDHIELELSVLRGVWKFHMEIPTVQLEWEKGPELEAKQTVSSAVVGKRKTKTKMRVRRFHEHFFFRFWPRFPYFLAKLQQAKARFYRGIHCTALEWRICIGFKDPAQTGLAAGAFWSLIGYSLARLYHQIKVEVRRPVLEVVPDFQKPGFTCDVHCIFKLRIGHIIFAGLNLARTLVRELRG
ncbi:DUF2953 domain-containing protein [Paradesulfitobacterium ferrireducens]|uniref:DUF2953 domain-containing protein n=1 Tax=Paradesulfitobacterium ferrireducens TaxID=2816476 RepID=UPI001A8D4E92|nr:DUF2953 domain-containing protein [Paradesulfitobacterium ferrireducens]